MQQSGFLSKLYDIKPFKIVESPQTLKKYQNDRPILSQSGSVQLYPTATLQSNKFSSSQSCSLSSAPILHPLKAQSCNIALNSTPTKIQSHPFIPQPSSSSKKIIKKYSINQPASPHRITLSKKSQSIIPIQQIILPSPHKTPNKQNNTPLPVGTMIQSQLYTNLSSSIDTLFSKIQKIKQEFQCPLSANKNQKQNGGKYGSNRGQRSSNRKNQRYIITKNLQNMSQISGYSPILQQVNSKDNPLSSLSSLSPLLPKQTNYQNCQQYRNSYNNRNLMNQIYKQPIKNFDNQSSVQSIQPFILPATHIQTNNNNSNNNNTNNVNINNINQINNKTKSIIDQINGLIDSNKKNHNNQYKDQNNVRNLRIKKYKKINSTHPDQPINCQYREHMQVINTVNDFKEFDQFDDQFLTIKLKSTQSQYVPKLVHQPSINQGTVNRSRAGSKYEKDYANVSYKIDVPLFKQTTQTQPAKSQQNIKIKSQNKSAKKNSSNSQKNQPFVLSMRQFQLGKCVGSGKFGDVHICKHKSTGFLFALKKIFKSTILQYNMIQQFTLQLKIHYSLSNNHPNITKLYTHFQDQYHIFLLMQYIEDGTLMNKLKQSQQFVSRIIYQVLNSIEYLHRNNIAHRDLKPQNILLTNGIAKICDFGWSSRFKDQMRRTFCGTLDYVSPQMKDKGQYNTSVDLWSIGVLTFQLLVGFPPYKKQIDKWKVLGGNIKDKWRWDVIYPPQISDCAQNFIDKLLKQNPDQRISIRECRQQEFIIKYNKKQNQCYYTKFEKILS